MNRVEPQAAELIVVLGGGNTVHSDGLGQIESRLSSISSARLLEGLLVHEATGLPLLFTGGSVLKGEGSATEADAARVLFQRAGLKANQFQLEEKSRNTYENALFTAEMTDKRAIILITSSFHMKRSILCFEEAGFTIVDIYPVDYRREDSSLNWYDFLPKMVSMRNSATALHEYWGLLYYKLFFKL
jgi:uncharacterized SAM-binding protein YcdF (DUF218 family)